MTLEGKRFSNYNTKLEATTEGAEGKFDYLNQTSEWVEMIVRKIKRQSQAGENTHNSYYNPRLIYKELRQINKRLTAPEKLAKEMTKLFVKRNTGARG